MMKVNLTDYIFCFSIFDSGFNPELNSLVKGKCCYNQTLKFFNQLDEVSQKFRPFADVKVKLDDISNYFVNSLAVQTNGAIKLVTDLQLDTAKYKVSYSHAMAKHILKNTTSVTSFLSSLNVLVDDTKHMIKQMHNLTIQKVDDVDRQLLATAVTETALADRAFGGGVYTHTAPANSRPVSSLMVNGDLVLRKRTAEEIALEQKLTGIIDLLQMFVFRCNEAVNKFGFSIAPSSPPPDTRLWDMIQQQRAVQSAVAARGIPPNGVPLNNDVDVHGVDNGGDVPPQPLEDENEN